MSASQNNTDFLLRKPAMPAPFSWGSNKSLSVAVQAAVGRIDEKVLAPRTGWDRFSPIDAKRLLALLSWSYARALYSSAEIHSRLRRGWTAELWEGGVPDAEDISRFRTEFQGTLQSCLQVALHFLAAQKVSAGIVTRINELAIAAEASRRIITSIFVDNVEATALAML